MIRIVSLAVVLGLSLTLPAAAAKDPVVAEVNGKKIYLSDVESVRNRLPTQLQKLPTEKVFTVLLNSLISTKVLATEADRQGLRKDKEFRRQISWVEEQLLERILLTRYFEKKITDKALKERYKKKIKKSPPVEEIKASHILLDTEAEAREVIDALKAGADFAKLAAERSKGPSKSDGGNLGYFSRKEMVPEFSDAAFGLKKGEFTTDPVKTRFGWHVIKQLDRRNAKPPEFKDYKEKLRSELSNELGASYIKRLRKDANIKSFNIDGSPLE